MIFVGALLVFIAFIAWGVSAVLGGRFIIEQDDEKAFGLWAWVVLTTGIAVFSGLPGIALLVVGLVVKYTSP